VKSMAVALLAGAARDMALARATTTAEIVLNRCILL
jgi:hypothetical protein